MKTNKIRGILALLMAAMTMTMAMPAMAVPTNNAVVTGAVAVNACPIGTVGITTDVATMDFGQLTPGEASESSDVKLAITPTGYYDLVCQDLILEGDTDNLIDEGVAPVDIAVTVSADAWVGKLAVSSMAADSTVMSIVINGVVVTGFGTHQNLPVGDSSTLSFVVTPPVGTVPDTYTQTITITGIY